MGKRTDLEISRNTPYLSAFSQLLNQSESRATAGYARQLHRMFVCLTWYFETWNEPCSMPDGQDRSIKQHGPNSFSSPSLPKYPHCAFYPGTFSFMGWIIPNPSAQKPFLLATLEGFFLTYLQPILSFCRTWGRTRRGTKKDTFLLKSQQITVFQLCHFMSIQIFHLKMHITDMTCMYKHVSPKQHTPFHTL